MKYIIIFLISFTNLFTIVSQTFHDNYNTYHNLERYWYYRERLYDYIWRHEETTDEDEADWSSEGFQRLPHDSNRAVAWYKTFVVKHLYKYPKNQRLYKFLHISCKCKFPNLHLRAYVAYVFHVTLHDVFFRTACWYGKLYLPN